MKKRMLALLLASLTLVALLAGCNRDSASQNSDSPNTDDADEPAFVYQATYLPLELPEDATNVYNLCISGDKAYFACDVQSGTRPYIDPSTGEQMLDQDGNPVEIPVQAPAVFQLDLATNAVTKMEGFVASEIPEGMEGYVSINNLFPGADNTVWVCEQLYAYASAVTGDVPVADDGVVIGSSDGVTVDVAVADTAVTTVTASSGTLDPYDPNYQEINQTRYLQLDSTGALVKTLDLATDEQRYENFSRIAFDDAGNICAMDWSNLYFFDPDGVYQGKLEVPEGISSMLSMGDGKVYVTGWRMVEDEGFYALSQVDFATRTLSEESKRLPSSAYEIYAGNDAYDFFYNNNGTIYGYDLESGAEQRLFAWLDCDINDSNIYSFTIGADGKVLALEGIYDETNYKTNYSIVSLNQVDASTVPEKKELTLACMYLDWNMKSDIVEFNRTHDDLRIQVEDYSQYNTDDNYEAGLQKLNTEILSGKVPDILMTDQLPVDRYAAKGVLLDLWEFIDNDPELSREDLMTHLFDVMSIDGKLYEAVSSFGIVTVAGRTDIVGDRTNWTLQELQDTLATMGDNVSIFGEYDTKSSILASCVNRNAEAFIDWNTRQCTFDSPEFIDMLNFANSFPKEFDSENYDWSTSESEFTRLHTGKQMLTQAYLWTLSDVQYQQVLHGGDVTFIGYPTTTGNGSSFSVSGGMAISSACSDPQAAWNFVKHYLSEDYQTQSYIWQFPTNKHSFEALKKQAMTQEYYEDPETGEQVPVASNSYWFEGDEPVEVYAMTEEEFAKFEQVYESCNTVQSFDTEINNIISEEAAAFFDGQKTAEETARLIQDRVSLYVAQQA